MTITTVHVKEIGMVAPDIMYVRVRDQEIVKGSLYELIGGPDPGTMFSTVLRPNPNKGGASEYCMIGGQRSGTLKMFQHFRGVMPSAFLNRTVVDNPASWASIGGRTITTVYRKTKPYDQGVSYNGAQEVSDQTMEHELFVKLSGNLPQGGPYTVSVTGNTFPATAFTFNDRVTRCPAIRTTLIGHRPGELEKKARLQIWIPGYGTEGRVNFASTYSVSAFELIDAQGVTVFTGTASLLYNPTDVDETGGASTEYPSTTTAPKVATAATRANPCKITVSSHGYTNGDRKAFFGFGEDAVNGTPWAADPNGFHGAIYTITVVDTNNFTIPLNTSAVPNPYVPGVYLAGYDSLVRAAFTANIYNTYVYGLDFSSFNPATYQGYFRIRIPGIGVSDAFLIEEDAHWAKIVKHAQGYYNQATGIALDPAIGGWAREATYRDGYNGQIIYESTMPAWFSFEAITASAPYVLPTLDATNATWRTTNRVTNGFITTRDAGDWDWNNIQEVNQPYLLLEYGYRQLPVGVRDFNIPFPKASALDATVYAGTDGLGVQFHMAALQLDHFRKFQKGDGRVYGGVAYNEEVGSEGDHPDNIPSQYSTATAYLLAADPLSNLFYAASAAKMAQVLKENGFTTAATTWQTSAVAAYNWSESLYQDYLANGATGSVIQGYFNTTLGFQAKSGFSNPTFAGAMTAMMADTIFPQVRRWAIATLYNLTDSKTTYGDKIAAVFAISQNDFDGHAVWEFCQAPSATSYVTPQNQVAYYNATWPAISVHPFQDSIVWYRAVWKFLSGTRNFSNVGIKGMQATVADHTGANQLGRSRTVGLGPADRYPGNSLIRDRQAMELPTSSVLGTTIYFQNGTAGFGWAQFSTDSPANFTVELPTGLFEATNGTKKIVTPPHSAYPRVEANWDNHNNVQLMEFTGFQTIVPEFCRAAIMHCWDGNTQITAPARRIRRTLNCS